MKNLATTTTKSKAKTKTNAPAPTLYTFGLKAPRLGNNNMNDTKRSWEFLTALITKEGPQAVATMQVLLKEEYNHACFVKYAIKNKWLVAA